MDTEADLPRSNVRRIVKQKLTELKGTSGSDIHLNRDALTALGESARVFIHLLSATANDICLDKKRQTISVDDILEALEELEFSDLISQLEGDIEDHRLDMKARAKKRSESMKKRKAQKAADELLAEAAREKEAEENNKERGNPSADEGGEGEGATASVVAAAAASDGGKGEAEPQEKEKEENRDMDVDNQTAS
eukprot:CAMPEP_0197472614 /NCGR_PEP_ID=MMETSP1309-20131121/3821_1 /TAXON_ID=464262 /ORGANISM="Genus nov. species nov., Strain RCC998" /LENGTH=193 /DNA_ID=CAMNT_0043011263 /DNA_START=82 /DNA_END=663 /DNA_ORIENTATION=-